MTKELDDTTASAIAEETGSIPAVETTPPETPAPSVKETDELIGSFENPDYDDVLSDKDRMEEPPVEEIVARPLDPVIPTPAPVATVPETVATPLPVLSTPQSVVPEPVPPAPTPREVITPEQQEADFAKLTADVEADLTKLYTMSPEEAAKLDDFERKPSEYLPGLLAKAHQNAYAHAYQAIMEALPDVVGQVQQTSKAQVEAENEFHTRWPELKGQDEIAVRAINTYRQMNPKATVQESIERAGMLAMIELGKYPSPQASVAETPAATPFTPPPRPVQPGSFGTVRAAPVSYEEGVYDEILRDERNFGRG